MDYKSVARKWALYNRMKYDKLDLGSIISKVVAELPEIKKNIREIIPEIKKIVIDIQKLSKEEAIEILEREFPNMLQERKKETRKGLPPLPKAEKGKVKTRFAPNPSGYLHMGHARAIVLNYEYARMYNGIFVVRLEDTDPKVKKPVLEAYENIKEDVEWLIEDKVDEFYIQSERLEIYYDYARRLIEMEKAYVDLCNHGKIAELRRRGEYCEHRNMPVEWHLEQWDKMLEGGYDEGQAVLRIKTDLHPNPSVRDWIAFRIVNPEKNPHPWLEYKYGENYAKKFWVWPTYNFAVAIDDHLMGLTHIFRMKEHEVNTIKQRYIYKYFKWKSPVIINYGAFIVRDMPLHKSEIRRLIEAGKVEGWCDPFLPTLCGLRRRGILPKAIKKYIIEVGPNPADVVVNWEKIYRYNREIIDNQSKRLFFVEDPIRVFIENLPDNLELKIKNHPDIDLGCRNFKISKPYVYIEKGDLKYKYIRLMEGFNIELISVGDNITAKYIDNSLDTAKKIGAKIVQWVPEEYAVKITVWKSDGRIKGIGEKYINEIKDGEIVHFIRYGFLKREKEHFIYMHK
ncbi:MAG TPA: glutamate--tRNA ligase [Candidatus Nanopusillus sp.]|nr:glutamate--tRNA ligase [Candidatus Nanopusillus sp.]